MTADRRSYRFEDFTLIPAERQLVARGREVVLRPKAFETLVCLVQRRGHAVAREELLDAVWPETSVSEAVLTHCISEVRQALSDESRHPRFVKTLSRHGYKFIAPVVVVDPPPEGPAAVAAPPVPAEALPAATPPVAPSVVPAPAPPVRPEAPGASRSAIVVLPFANMSGDPDNEYLCDGLAEELINGLTKVGGLQVVAHSSSFSFKGLDVDAREIGRRLQVGTILEGSVRRAGDRLRVSVQLIDAARGYHLWCEQYDRRFEDLFGLQDEIASAVLGSLDGELLGAGRTPLVTPRTADMDAYALYLRGRAFWHQRYHGGLQRAMDCFGQAIARDPGFAPPYTGLADSLSTLGIWGSVPPRDAFPKAAALADTAARLQPSLAEAHASRALIRLFWDWEWEEAGRGFERAVDLNPGCALIRLWNGHFLSIVGRMDEAIAEMKRAQVLDPLSPVCTANVGWTFHLAHRQDEAAVELGQVLAREPENGIALFYRGYVLIETGRYQEAIDALRKAQEVTRGMPWSAEGIGLAQGLMGNREAAMEALAEARVRAATGYVPRSAVALVHLGLGDDEATLGCLERAVEDRDALLPWLKFIPAFGRLHAHPRFQSILAGMGL